MFRECNNGIIKKKSMMKKRKEGMMEGPGQEGMREGDRRKKARKWLFANEIKDKICIPDFDHCASAIFTTPL
jgi:hypothetical protein